jgi:hypothetical protein
MAPSAAPTNPSTDIDIFRISSRMAHAPSLVWS